MLIRFVKIFLYRVVNWLCFSFQNSTLPIDCCPAITTSWPKHKTCLKCLQLAKYPCDRLSDKNQAMWWTPCLHTVLLYKVWYSSNTLSTAQLIWPPIQIIELTLLSNRWSKLLLDTLTRSNDAIVTFIHKKFDLQAAGQVCKKKKVNITFA